MIMFSNKIFFIYDKRRLSVLNTFITVSHLKYSTIVTNYLIECERNRIFASEMIRT
jgi:hypothetical protein